MSHQYLFYIDRVDQQNGIVLFDAEESHHITNVLRKADGSRIEATDGRGWKYAIQLDATQPKRCKGIILEKQFIEMDAPLPVQIGIPCLKGDRWQTIVEVSAEIGVSAICPLEFEQAQVQWSEAKLEKARRKAREALKQSGGCYLTGITEPFTLHRAVSRDDFSRVYYADSEGEPLGSIEPQSLLVIGPEAGFSARESRLLMDAGARRFSLGHRRLRSEVAAIAAVAQAQQQFK
ncbi:RsmE family RNA methyltransferase [bacterium]|nr:RsmE family RNA methyltransferase [bacterium]MBU1650921.1 RsmE family RNA methyltransferase [bacterium]MBU1881909.1 RsmE family RNA methyltransferase [bacterium]